MSNSIKSIKAAKNDAATKIQSILRMRQAAKRAAGLKRKEQNRLRALGKKAQNVINVKYSNNWRQIEARMATKYPNLDLAERTSAIENFKRFLILKVIEKVLRISQSLPSLSLS